MTLNKFVIALLINTALGQGAFCQSVPKPIEVDAAKTWNIAPVYKTGEVINYKFKSNAKMAMTTEKGQSPFPGGDMVMDMKYKYKTLKALDDGGADMEVLVSGGEMNMMGQIMPIPETPAIKMSVDKRGALKNVSGLDKLPGGDQMKQMLSSISMPSSGVYFPDKPVKIGDTWTGNIPSLNGGKNNKVECKLKGAAIVDGVQALIISQKMILPMNIMMGMNGMPVTNEADAMMIMIGEFATTGDNYIASDTGKLLRLTGTVDGGFKMVMKGEAASQNPFGAMSMKLNGKVEMFIPAAADPVVKKTTVNTAKKPKP